MRSNLWKNYGKIPILFCCLEKSPSTGFLMWTIAWPLNWLLTSNDLPVVTLDLLLIRLIHWANISLHQDELYLVILYLGAFLAYHWHLIVVCKAVYHSKTWCIGYYQPISSWITSKSRALIWLADEMGYLLVSCGTQVCTNQSAIRWHLKAELSFDWLLESCILQLTVWHRITMANQIWACFLDVVTVISDILKCVLM